MKALKNDEKCFLFCLKTSFRSQDIQIFVLTFWSCRKNGLISITLILKFMTSQSGQQNNCNTQIYQYLTKLKQPGNEIWSVNRI